MGVWASKKTRVTTGDLVLVTGAGPIGFFVAQVARASGAATVTVTDVSEYRLGVAQELGFVAKDASSPLVERFDVFLESSGAQSAVETGLAALAPAGRAALVGSGTDFAQLDVPQLQTKELEIT